MLKRTWLLACAALATVVGLVASHPILERASREAWIDYIPGRVRDAMAQEVMTFEEVSPESAAAIERRRRDRGARSGLPAMPPMPAVPAVPGVPAPPTVSRAGDVVRIGSNIHIEENQVVDGDVFALRGDIEVDGHVKGNVATTGGDVRLGPTARVDGDVMCIGGELTEEPGAVVGGQRVTALRGREGRVRDRIRDRIEERLHDRISDRGGFGFVISWLLVTTLVAWLLARFAPGRTGVATQMLRDDAGASLMVGFLIVLLLIPSVVALILAFAVLCITIIGIPLALMMLPAYGLGLALLFLWGFATGVTVMGERFATMMSWPRTLANSALAGAVVVSGTLFAAQVLHFIPFFGWIGGLLWVLGWVTFGFVTLAGAGALVKSKFGQGPGGQWWPPFKRKPAAGPVTPASPAPSTGPFAAASDPAAAAPGSGAARFAAPPPADPPTT